jgi:hypothetical protein
MKDINKLSERQRNILRFMEKYIETYGFPPSIREIGEATGTNSTSVVNYNLNKLVQAGYLVRSSQKSRGLRLVKALNNGDKQGTGMLVQPALSVLRVPLVGQIVASEPVQVPDDVGYYYGEDDMIEVTPSLLQGTDPAGYGRCVAGRARRNNPQAFLRRGHSHPAATGTPHDEADLRRPESASYSGQGAVGYPSGVKHHAWRTRHDPFHSYTMGWLSTNPNEAVTTMGYGLWCCLLTPATQPRIGK